MTPKEHDALLAVVRALERVEHADILVRRAQLHGDEQLQTAVGMAAVSLELAKELVEARYAAFEPFFSMDVGPDMELPF